MPIEQLARHALALDSQQSLVVDGQVLDARDAILIKRLLLERGEIRIVLVVAVADAAQLTLHRKLGLEPRGHGSIQGRHFRCEPRQHDDQNRPCPEQETQRGAAGLRDRGNQHDRECPDEKIGAISGNHRKPRFHRGTGREYPERDDSGRRRGDTPDDSTSRRLPLSRSRAMTPAPSTMSSSGSKVCSTNAGVSCPNRNSKEDWRTSAKLALF